MKAFIAVLVLAAVATASNIDTFRAWQRAHGKVYTVAQEARRFAIFKENLAIIERLNLDSKLARFGVNKFSDLTTAEWAKIYVSGFKSERRASIHAVEADSVTANNDYRNYLPAVKDQAQCGSCWAFSAVANMEGQTYKTNGGTVVSLSEQQLVSCDKSDSGCNGGLMATADNYAIKAGMTSEASYPYTSGTGRVAACKSPLPTIVAKFKSVHDWGTISSDATMINYLDTYGPLSVAIAASTYYFQSYTSGILDDADACGTDLDHGVTLVGYGTEGGVNYWTIRNSWGQSWGDEGYVKFIRGKDMCLVNEAVSSIVA
jgi:C1A family cysteine protease